MPDTRCAAHTKRGQPCTQRPIAGTSPARCRMHGGRQQKGRDMRVFLDSYRLDQDGHDPLRVMLACVTLAWDELGRATDELEQARADSTYAAATVGEAVNERGYTTGEFLRGLVANQSLWYDRALKASAAAVGAGISERLVKLAERQAETVAAAVKAAVGELELSEEMRRAVVAGVGRHVRLIAS